MRKANVVHSDLSRNRPSSKSPHTAQKDLQGNMFEKHRLHAPKLKNANHNMADATGTVKKLFDSSELYVTLTSSYLRYIPELVSWPSNLLCTPMQSFNLPGKHTSQYKCTMNPSFGLTSCPMIFKANENYPQFVLATKSDAGFQSLTTQGVNFQCDNSVKFKFIPPNVSFVESILQLFRVLFTTTFLGYLFLAVLGVVMYWLFMHDFMRKKATWFQIKFLRFLRYRLGVTRFNKLRKKLSFMKQKNDGDSGFRYNDLDSSSGSEGFSEDEYVRTASRSRSSSKPPRGRSSARGIVSGPRRNHSFQQETKYERGRSRRARYD